MSPDWMDSHTVCTGAPMRKQIVVSSIKNDANIKQNPTALEKEGLQNSICELYVSNKCQI